VKYPISATTAH